MKMKKLFGMIVSMIIILSGTIALADADINTEPEDLQQNMQQTENLATERSQEMKRAISQKQDEVSLLSADDEITVSGTITLPEPASADGYIAVNLSPENKRDGNKVLNSFKIRNTSTYSSGYDTYAEVKKGDTTVNYSFSAEKGVYAIEFHCMVSGTARNCSVYYSEKGAALDLASADIIELTANSRFDITLPKAERTISGTITFDSPLPEDDLLEVSCESAENSYEVMIPVQKGQTETAYSIGVDKESYILSVNIYEDIYKAYSVTGTAAVNDPYYLNVNDQSLDHIDFTYSYRYSGESTEEPEPQEFIIPVTITLPEAPSKDVEYTIYGNYTATTEESDVYGSVKIKAGETSGSGELYVCDLSADSPFTLRIDINDLTYWYGAQGFSPNEEEAVPICYNDYKSIDFDLSDFTAIKGSVSRNGAKEGDILEATVTANIDGSSFYDNATIAETDETAPYFILVPNNLREMEYQIYAHVNLKSGSTIIKGEIITGTVSESNGDVNIAVRNIFTRMTGKVVLSDAAQRGVDVMIKSPSSPFSAIKSYTICSYCIREGESGFDYAIDVLGEADTADITLRFHSNDRRFTDVSIVDTTITKNGENIINIALPEYDQTISGQIAVPDTVDMTNAVSYGISAVYITADGEYLDVCLYDTLPKGEKTMPYSIAVPSSATLIELYAVVMSYGTVPLITDAYYGNDYEELNIPLTNGLSNADITFEKGKAIYGTIIFPEDAQLQDAFCDIEAIVANNECISMEYYRIENKETPYMIVIPENYTGEVTLFCRYTAMNDVDGIQVYYAGDKVALTEKNASPITIANANVTDIDFLLPTTKAQVTAHMSPPSYANINIADCLDGLKVYAVLDNGERIDSNKISIDIADNGNEIVASFQIPDVLEYQNVNGFKLYYDFAVNYMESNGYIFDYTNMYVNPDGTFTQDAEAAQLHPIQKKYDCAFTLWDNSVLLKDVVDAGKITINFNYVSASASSCHATLQYKNSDSKAYNATVLIIAYQQDTCVDMYKRQINFSNNSGNEALSFYSNGKADHYKILVWDNMELMSPIIEAKTVPVSN